jgi:hypothetical protein
MGVKPQRLDKGIKSAPEVTLSNKIKATNRALEEKRLQWMHRKDAPEGQEGPNSAK